MSTPEAPFASAACPVPAAVPSSAVLVAGPSASLSDRRLPSGGVWSAPLAPLGAPRTHRCIVFCSAAVRLVDRARRLDLDALASAWVCCVVSWFAAPRALPGYISINSQGKLIVSWRFVMSLVLSAALVWWPFGIPGLCATRIRACAALNQPTYRFPRWEEAA